MSAIGSIKPAATAPAAPAAPSQTGGLDADKAACEAKLADQVNCVSAKTPEGQAKIQELTSKLHGIEAKLEKAAQAKEEAKPDKTTAASASRPTGTVGNVVDVYA